MASGLGKEGIRLLGELEYQVMSAIWEREPSPFRVEKIEVVLNPHWIYFSPDGRFGFVTNWGANSISVVDLQQRKRVDIVVTGLNPNGVIGKFDVPRETLEKWRARTDEAREMVAKASNLIMPEPRSQAEEAFMNTCMVCHDVGRIVRNNYKGDDWVAIVERMKGNGAKMTAAEQEMIVEYLKSGQHKTLDIKTELEKLMMAGGANQES